ncbi:hypothetical protein CR513_36863, partial [Mucuna pruriens]
MTTANGRTIVMHQWWLDVEKFKLPKPRSYSQNKWQLFSRSKTSWLKEVETQRGPKSSRPKRQQSRSTYMYKCMPRPSWLKKTKSKLKPSLSWTTKERTLFHLDLTSKLNKEPSSTPLLKVLRQHKKAIGWTLSDLPRINPSICMHRILMEEVAKPIRKQQRRMNPTILDVVKKEVKKLLAAGIIYPISDS